MLDVYKNDSIKHNKQDYIIYSFIVNFYSSLYLLNNLIIR